MSRRIRPATPIARPESAPSRLAPDDSDSDPIQRPPQRKYSLGISGIGKREYQYCGTTLVSSPTPTPAAHGPARAAMKLADAHRNSAAESVVGAGMAWAAPMAEKRA